MFGFGGGSKKHDSERGGFGLPSLSLGNVEKTVSENVGRASNKIGETGKEIGNFLFGSHKSKSKIEDTQTGGSVGIPGLGGDGGFDISLGGNGNAPKLSLEGHGIAKPSGSIGGHLGGVKWDGTSMNVSLGGKDKGENLIPNLFLGGKGLPIPSGKIENDLGGVKWKGTSLDVSLGGKHGDGKAFEIPNLSLGGQGLQTSMNASLGGKDMGGNLVPNLSLGGKGLPNPSGKIESNFGGVKWNGTSLDVSLGGKHDDGKAFGIPSLPLGGKGLKTSIDVPLGGEDKDGNLVPNFSLGGHGLPNPSGKIEGNLGAVKWNGTSVDVSLGGKHDDGKAFGIPNMSLGGHSMNVSLSGKDKSENLIPNLSLGNSLLKSSGKMEGDLGGVKWNGTSLDVSLGGKHDDGKAFGIPNLPLGEHGLHNSSGGIEGDLGGIKWDSASPDLSLSRGTNVGGISLDGKQGINGIEIPSLSLGGQGNTSGNVGKLELGGSSLNVSLGAGKNKSVISLSGNQGIGKNGISNASLEGPPSNIAREVGGASLNTLLGTNSGKISLKGNQAVPSGSLELPNLSGNITGVKLKPTSPDILSGVGRKIIGGSVEATEENNGLKIPNLSLPGQGIPKPSGSTGELGGTKWNGTSLDVSLGRKPNGGALGVSKIDTGLPDASSDGGKDEKGINGTSPIIGLLSGNDVTNITLGGTSTENTDIFNATTISEDSSILPDASLDNDSLINTTSSEGNSNISLGGSEGLGGVGAIGEGSANTTTESEKVLKKVEDLLLGKGKKGAVPSEANLVGAHVENENGISSENIPERVTESTNTLDSEETSPFIYENEVSNTNSSESTGYFDNSIEEITENTNRRKPVVIPSYFLVPNSNVSLGEQFIPELPPSAFDNPTGKKASFIPVLPPSVDSPFGETNLTAIGIYGTNNNLSSIVPQITSSKSSGMSALEYSTIAVGGVAIASLLTFIYKKIKKATASSSNGSYSPKDHHKSKSGGRKGSEDSEGGNSRASEDTSQTNRETTITTHTITNEKLPKPVNETGEKGPKSTQMENIKRDQVQTSSDDNPAKTQLHEHSKITGTHHQQLVDVIIETPPEPAEIICEKHKPLEKPPRKIKATVLTAEKFTSDKTAASNLNPDSLRSVGQAIGGLLMNQMPEDIDKNQISSESDPNPSEDSPKDASVLENIASPSNEEQRTEVPLIQEKIINNSGRNESMPNWSDTIEEPGSSSSKKRELDEGKGRSVQDPQNEKSIAEKKSVTSGSDRIESVGENKITENSTHAGSIEKPIFASKITCLGGDTEGDAFYASMETEVGEEYFSADETSDVIRNVLLDETSISPDECASETASEITHGQERYNLSSPDFFDTETDLKDSRSDETQGLSEDSTSDITHLQKSTSGKVGHERKNLRASDVYNTEIITEDGRRRSIEKDIEDSLENSSKTVGETNKNGDLLKDSISSKPPYLRQVGITMCEDESVDDEVSEILKRRRSDGGQSQNPISGIKDTQEQIRDELEAEYYEEALRNHLPRNPQLQNIINGKRILQYPVTDAESIVSEIMMASNLDALTAESLQKDLGTTKYSEGLSQNDIPRDVLLENVFNSSELSKGSGTLKDGTSKPGGGDEEINKGKIILGTGEENSKQKDHSVARRDLENYIIPKEQVNSTKSFGTESFISGNQKELLGGVKNDLKDFIVSKESTPITNNKSNAQEYIVEGTSGQTTMDENFATPEEALGAYISGHLNTMTSDYYNGKTHSTEEGNNSVHSTKWYVPVDECSDPELLADAGNGRAGGLYIALSEESSKSPIKGLDIPVSHPEINAVDQSSQEDGRTGGNTSNKTWVYLDTNGHMHKVNEVWPSHLPKNVYAKNLSGVGWIKTAENDIFKEEETEATGHDKIVNSGEKKTLGDHSSNIPGGINCDSRLRQDCSQHIPKFELPNMDKRLLKKKKLRRRQIKSLDSGVHHYYGEYMDLVEFPEIESNEGVVGGVELKRCNNLKAGEGVCIPSDIKEIEVEEVVTVQPDGTIKEEKIIIEQ